MILMVEGRWVSNECLLLILKLGELSFSQEIASWSLCWEKLEADSAVWQASRPFWSSASLPAAVACYLSSRLWDDSVIIMGRRLVPTTGNNHIRRLRLWFLNSASCLAWRAATPWLNPFLPLWPARRLPTNVKKLVTPGFIHRPVQPIAEWAYSSVCRC